MRGAIGVREDNFSALLGSASIEVSARDPLAGEDLAERFASGTATYVNVTAADTHHGIIAAARRLKRAGFLPVPHVAARYLASFTQLNDYLARLAGEAGVRRALLLAGDPERPVGPFSSSLDLLETGLFEKHGLREIGIAGYPEGHPRIARRALERALAAKRALARERGLDLHIVTQFGFEAAPIIAWISEQRSQGFAGPVRVGLAGPASIASLAKFAVRCGVGQSLRALTRGHAAVARLLTEASPEAIIRALAGADPAVLTGVGLHFFTFGGVRRTGEWLGAMLAAAAGEFDPGRPS